MSLSDAKAIYQSLLDSDDLLEMFPSLTGDWEADKHEFQRLHSANEQLLDDLDGVLDLDDDEF
jgi:hypothetical protein